MSLHLRDRWTAAYEAAAYDAYEAAYFAGDPIPAPVPLAAVLLALVLALVADLRCRWSGHVLEVDACIGPDHGSEHFGCTRCGWSDTITYY